MGDTLSPPPLWTSAVLSIALIIISFSIKISWYGFDNTWFKSYLGGRRQLVKGGSLSLSLTHGVPQGSLIGPILFSIFTNDLASFLPHGRLVSYADDTSLLDSAPANRLSDLKSRQEETLKSVQSYFNSNSLKMNPTKTILLLVGTSHTLQNTTSFSLNVAGHILTPSPSGVHALDHSAPSVAEWSKAPEFDAETGGESPVQAPVWAVTFSPYV